METQHISTNKLKSEDPLPSNEDAACHLKADLSVKLMGQPHAPPCASSRRKASSGTRDEVFRSPWERAATRALRHCESTHTSQCLCLLMTSNFSRVKRTCKLLDSIVGTVSGSWHSPKRKLQLVTIRSSSAWSKQSSTVKNRSEWEEVFTRVPFVDCLTVET